eukprot:GDKH01015783.1.p1 GENE.GDKH01015783.1~~GDKH01015783.1.p1  ORF type:complete len:108 (-),score=21.92 GDKH01015783.1:97-420(-)
MEGETEGQADAGQMEQLPIDRVTAGILEVTGVAHMLSRMQSQCYAKCVPDSNKVDLVLGEMSCIDRCVSKYCQLNTVVGEKLAEVMKANQAQQEAILQMQEKLGVKE